jgi:hypothetical protein
MRAPVFYDVLEVSPKASPEVIRAAYKSLMQRHHPDKIQQATAQAGQAALISQAYEVLSDPQKRAAYDQSLLIPPAMSGAPIARNVRTAPAKVAHKSSRYAWFLIVCIVVAGSLLLLWPSRNPQEAVSGKLVLVPGSSGIDTATMPAVTASKPLAVDANASPPPPEVNAFVSDLTIVLAPAVAAGGAGTATHALHIPSLGFRISAQDPARWVQRLETDRATVMHRLISELGNAGYQELIQTDGDLYLKRLIETSVGAAIGLEAAPVAAEKPQPRPIEALLPGAFSVR